MAKMLLVFSALMACAFAQNFQSFIEATAMPYPLSDMVAVTFDTNIAYPSNDGPRIYIQGGCTKDQTCTNDTLAGTVNCFCQEITAKCIFFKPEKGSWHTSCADAPVARYRHSAARIGQYLFVAMGRDIADNIITTIDRYDTLADVWTTPYTWPAATSDGGAFSYGTRLYLVGGYLADYSVSTALTMVDTLSGAFTAMAPMAVGRGDISVVPFKGLFYVLGGWSDDFCTARKTAERYFPANDTWASVADMMYGRGDLAAGSIQDYMFSIAGETKDASCTLSVPVRNVGRYDGTRNEWFLEQDIPLDLFRFVGASYNSSSGSVIYLFGGQGSYDPTRSLYPLKDTTIRYIPRTYASSGGSGLSDSGIAGVVIGVIVALAVLLFAAFVYIGYTRGIAYKRHHNTVDLPMTTDPSSVSNV